MFFCWPNCWKSRGEQGLPPEVARKLARGTLYGAGCMLHTLPTDADELRRNVTSPGGTTAEHSRS